MDEVAEAREVSHVEEAVEINRLVAQATRSGGAEAHLVYSRFRQLVSCSVTVLTEHL